MILQHVEKQMVFISGCGLIPLSKLTENIVITEIFMQASKNVVPVLLKKVICSIIMRLYE